MQNNATASFFLLESLCTGLKDASIHELPAGAYWPVEQKQVKLKALV